MFYLVMSKGKYADGGRGWTSNKAAAWNFFSDLESAKHHAETFRNPVAQRALGFTYAHRDVPGHRDAHVVGFFEDE